MCTKRLFNNKPPLFKITKNNKSSHLFGSCHSTSLDSLYTGNYLAKLLGHENGNNLINFLNNRGTLITEFGYHGNIKYYLDSDTDFKKKTINHSQDNELKSHEEIILEKDLYLRIQKIIKYKPAMVQYFFYNPFTYFIKDKKLIEALSSTNVNSFHKITSLSLANIIYNGFCYHGIDSTLALYYTKNNKYAYSLDYPTKEDNFVGNICFKKYIYKFLLVTILMNFKYSYNSILDTMNSTYLQGNISKTDYKNTKLVTDRNMKWMHWINRYHHETEDPLFVVGEAHLYGTCGLLNLLKKENYEIASYDLELNTQPFI